jgi:hypothetical protein
MSSCASDTVYFTDDTMEVILDSVPISVTDFNIDESSTKEDVSNSLDNGKQEAVTEITVSGTMNVIVRKDGGGAPVIVDIKTGSCYALEAYLRQPDTGYVGDILIDNVGFPVAATNKTVIRPVAFTFQGTYQGPNLTP